MTDTILVPLDGSELAEQALPHAAALARALAVPVTLARVPESVVVPVVSAGIWITHEVEAAEAREQAEAYLSALAESPIFEGITVGHAIPSVPVAAGLLDIIEAEQPQLVVMTTHGRSGLQRVLLGSVADKLVRSSPAPVYLVRASETPPEPRFDRILVPLDGSELSRAALGPATELARATGASLLLVRVPTVPGYTTVIPENAGMIPALLREETLHAGEHLERLAQPLRDAGLTVDTEAAVVMAGTVAEGLLTAAQDQSAGLIMMTTHGRSGIGRWLFGSVADGIVRHAEVPVWLIRSRRD